MKITEVKVYPVNEDRLKAYVSLTIDDCFIIRDLKIIDGSRYDYSRNAFRYSFDTPYNMSLSATQSVWRAQLGIKYNF